MRINLWWCQPPGPWKVNTELTMYQAYSKENPLCFLVQRGLKSSSRQDIWSERNSRYYQIKQKIVLAACLASWGENAWRELMWKISGGLTKGEQN